MTDRNLEVALVAAARAAFRDPDRALFPAARRHLLDCAGVALAGVVAAPVRSVADVAPTVATGARARLLGSGRAVTPRDAALINGMAGHFHDYDDDDPAISIGHPTVPVFAALTGTAELTGASAGAAIAAYLAGVETTMTMGRVINPAHYDAGHHATATLGIFGATMAASLLMELDDAEAAHALGLAASLASGLKGNFGSDAKPLQVGVAAGNGVWAAQLARAGVRAAPGALLGPAGFCAVHHGRDAAEAVAAFGRPFGFLSPGLNIKQYPCCSSAHTAVDALLEILAEGRLGPADVESIDAWIGPDVPAILIYDVPDNPLQGKFSLRYCLAAATRFGKLGLDEFEPAAFADRNLEGVLGCVGVHVDTGLPRIPTGVTHASRVRVRTRGGQEFVRQVADPFGSSARPLPDAALRKKFVHCAARCISEHAAERAYAGWMQMPDDAPFARLLDFLIVGAGA